MSLILGGHRGSGCTDHSFYLLNQKEEQENTIKSFKKAFSDGASYIELDVILSEDKECLALHSVIPEDHFFEKIPEKNLNLLKLEKILTYYAGRKPHKINTLAQILLALKRQKKTKTPWTVNIELKGVIGSNQEYDGFELCEAVKKVIEKTQFPNEKLLFSSFCFHNLLIMKQLIPQAKFGLLLSEKNHLEPCYSNYQKSLQHSYLPFYPFLLRELPLKFVDYLHPETSSITIEKLDLIKNDFNLNAWTLFEELSELFISNHIKFSQYASKLGMSYTLITDHVYEINHFLTET